MLSLIIGISSGLLIILIFIVFKQVNKRIVYGLILSGIGFLYVGFVWTDTPTLIQNCIQAIVFLFLSYYGVVAKNIMILAAGYFLHGGWDIVYSFFNTGELIPPNYDLFCSALDITIGIYILLFRKHFHDRPITSSNP